jgi:hypothetical protein
MGIDAWFLAHALPSATVEDANGWEDRITAGLPIVFEKIVIVDRCEFCSALPFTSPEPSGSAHSIGGEVGKWGKMNADVAALRTPTAFWSGISQNVMRSVGADGATNIASRGLPVVVYVDTQVSTSGMMALTTRPGCQRSRKTTGRR